MRGFKRHGPDGARCKSNSEQLLPPASLDSSIVSYILSPGPPRNLLPQILNQAQLSLPLGLLSLGALPPYLPRGMGVCVGMGLGGGGRLDFDRQLGSWAAVGRAPPRPSSHPSWLQKEAGVGATSQGNCSCPEQTQAGDRARAATETGAT